MKCQFFIKFSCEEKVFPYNDECPEKDGEPGGGRDKKTFLFYYYECFFTRWRTRSKNFHNNKTRKNVKLMDLHTSHTPKSVCLL